MRPKISQNVIVHGIDSNGSKEQAAIVTRVWFSHDPMLEPANDSAYVNLTVLPDCDAPMQRSSVAFYATREAAMASYARQPYPGRIVAFWP